MNRHLIHTALRDLGIFVGGAILVVVVVGAPLLIIMSMWDR